MEFLENIDNSSGKQESQASYCVYRIDSSDKKTSLGILLSEEDALEFIKRHTPPGIANSHTGSYLMYETVIVSDKDAEDQSV